MPDKDRRKALKVATYLLAKHPQAPFVTIGNTQYYRPYKPPVGGIQHVDRYVYPDGFSDNDLNDWGEV
jgi:hypothetical protein